MTVRIRSSRRGLGRLLGCALALAIPAAALGLLQFEPLVRNAAAAAAARVAVMEFVAGSADAAQSELGAGLQSMLTTDLSQVSNLVLVERARLQDLTRELNLGSSGLVDAATAAKLGKLSGATHLVTGTYTLRGEKMRLDCRLLEVATGKVVSASSAEGEKDAFFELEKNLVVQLLAAMAVTPSAKERGAIAKNQTTDFEAFRRFSEGLRFFDDKKYDEALVALRSAAQKDEDFKLARVTLAEYETLVASLRARADGIETEQEQAAARAQSRAASEKQAVLDTLFAIAGEKEKETPERRALALYLLAQSLEGKDLFARGRAKEALAQRYHMEAVALYPRLPLFVGTHAEGQVGSLDYLSKVTSLAEFVADFSGLLEGIGCLGPVERDLPGVPASDGPTLRPCGLSGRWPGDSWPASPTARLGRGIFVDRLGEVELVDRSYQLAQQLKPEPRWNRAVNTRRAVLRRLVLDLDASTKLFAAVSAGEKDPKALRKVAVEIEANRELTRALGTTQADSPRRELLLLLMDANREHWVDVTWKATWWKDLQHIPTISRPPAVPPLTSYFKGDELTEAGLVKLRRLRQLDRLGFFLIGDQPVWNFGSPLWSGPRRDPLRADEVRFCGECHSEARDAPIKQNLLIVGGVPRRDLTARTDVSFAVPREFRSDGSSPGRPVGARSGGRPSVTVVYGATCVTLCMVAQKPKNLIHALAIRISDERIQYGKLEPNGSEARFSPHGDIPGGFGHRERAALRIDVRSGTPVVSIAGRKYKLPASKAIEGFAGFYFDGEGYVALRKPTVTALE